MDDNRAAQMNDGLRKHNFLTFFKMKMSYTLWKENHYEKQAESDGHKWICRGAVRGTDRKEVEEEEFEEWKFGKKSSRQRATLRWILSVGANVN